VYSLERLLLPIYGILDMYTVLVFPRGGRSEINYPEVSRDGAVHQATLDKMVEKSYGFASRFDF
jgi:hypothetical protein